MHKSISKENNELSKLKADDNYLRKTEKLEFDSQCKNTIKQKIDVVNLGMFKFSTVSWKK